MQENTKLEKTHSPKKARPRKVENNHTESKLNKFKHIFWRNFWLILPLFTLNIFIIIHILSLGINNFYKSLLIICFVFPGLFFLFFILFSKAKKELLSQDDQEFIYTKKVSNFTLFISLFIFYATFFIGILIFRERLPEGEIPYLKDGTIGMRAWQSRVIVKDIKIHYDSLGMWRLIPDRIVYNSNNWTMTSWDHDKLNGQIDHFENQKCLKKLFYCKDLTIKDSIYHCINDTSFIVQNCTLIFTPPDSIYQNIFHDIRFKCTVSFEKINRPKGYLFPGFQLITFIDTNRVINEKGIKDFSELCLQFNLGMNNNHHPWIPALDYEPAIKFASTINKMERYGNYNTMKVGKSYSISAIILNEKVLFLGHTDGTVKLFEAQLAVNK